MVIFFHIIAYRESGDMDLPENWDIIGCRIKQSNEPKIIDAKYVYVE